MLGTNDFGCTATDDVEVVLLTDMIIPNAFSPNGDGVNDEWRIKNAELYNIDLTIFDRWGNAVYRNSNFKGFWNGRADNGRALSTDTYFYNIKYSGLFHEDNRLTGHINLLR